MAMESAAIRCGEAPAPTFVLGLGAQKAGTTWLHDYLGGMGCANFGFAKEYHILDALHLPECRSFHRQRIERARAMLAEGGRRFGATPTLWREIAFEADIAQYHDYFTGLARHRPGVCLTGDITPSYAGLPARVLAETRAAFAARGVRTVAVFLMRDPVERCWSAVRMARRRRRADDPAAAERLTEAEALRRYAGSRLAEFRTRYDLTVMAIEAAFPPEDIFLGFYETLFEEAELARLCRVLGVPFRTPDTGRRLNASAKGAPLDPAVCRQVAERFAPVYRFAAARYGAERIARLWPGARLLPAEAGRQVPAA
ncbi:hypothetical protein LNKW23_29090 [Paralimibaculum aggregatum]|uniref:Sulfotransferase family protein n=1 Tax=Paralimibaculum aggregatum TaxID=3036245 RepID=A0ABQ6LML7_9RHOB|nr:sulfotransferase [Limibaculum sp. NKW23]GMG83696.1 hypothetical protein LNKW23_29090 [Limibaculum sp. NKW23]